MDSESRNPQGKKVCHERTHTRFRSVPFIVTSQVTRKAVGRVSAKTRQGPAARDALRKSRRQAFRSAPSGRARSMVLPVGATLSHTLMPDRAATSAAKTVGSRSKASPRSHGAAATAPIWRRWRMCCASLARRTTMSGSSATAPSHFACAGGRTTRALLHAHPVRSVRCRPGPISPNARSAGKCALSFASRKLPMIQTTCPISLTS